MASMEQTGRPHTLLTVEAEKSLNVLKKFRAAYDNDEKLRARIDAGDVAPLLEMLDPSVAENKDVELRVVTDTDEVQHMIMPPDPTWVVRDSDMSSISGGSTVGSAGTVGSASTLLSGCFPSSFGCVGSAGTAGSREV